MLNKRRELLPQRGGVLGAQIDLVVGAADGEPYRLGRRATIKIIFQCDGHSLRHVILPYCK
jgi:hypothetical protein